MSSEKERHSVILNRKNNSYVKAYGKKKNLTRSKKGKPAVNINKTLVLIIEEHPNFAEKIEELRKENEELKQRELYLNDVILGKSEEKLYNKAMGLEYPNDCHDMFSLKDDPTKRRCMCPSAHRPVTVPLIKGKYIVDDPRLCRRCKALGYRKAKEKPKAKHTQYNGGQQQKKHERREGEFRGYRNGIWQTSNIWKG